ncbi:hypothetical protein CPB86DRAFT_820157 [Serendipita vermifera]|nr:hypothetical protein CPB86DRAFT_820157 [Serendipita vermifera]
MIGLLPLLLYLSFSLFFAGLVLWLFHVNKFVFWTTLSIFCLGILFYLGTTTLAVIFNDAPFDTPLSDGLSRLIIRKRQEDRERDAVSNDTDLEIRVLMDQLDTLEWRIHLLPDLSKTLGSFLRLKKPQTLPSQEMFQTRQVKWTKMFRQTIDHFAQMDNDQEQDVEIFSESAAILRYSTLKPTGYFDSNGVSETVVEGLIKSSNLICNEDANNSLPSDHESKTFFFHVALQKQYYMSFYDPQCSTVLENLSHILDLLPTHETISGTLIRDISTITTSAILGIHGKQRSPGLYLPQLPYNVILDGDIPEYREQADLWKNAVERLYAALYPIRPPRSWKALTWYPLRLLTDLSLADTQTINSEDRGRITQILRRIFSNACMKLRKSDTNSWENVLSDIALLLLPNVQKEFEYIMLPELLVASVQLGTVSGVGADKFCHS